MIAASLSGESIMLIDVEPISAEFWRLDEQDRSTTPGCGRCCMLLVDAREHVFVGTHPPIATILDTKTPHPWQINVLRRYGIR